MFNPLVNKLSELTDSEIEEKISELSRKYFMSRNPQVQEQISNVLEMYKQEMYSRRAIEAQRQKQQMEENGDNGLDNLINVS